jgi:hypothetical protein
VTAETEPVTSGGWRIGTGFAASIPARHAHHFYAVYAGDAFGHPERGIIAAIARAHPEAQEHAAGARDSAQLTVHSLAEGYFGAQRTLSSRRAASLALTTVNRWLAGQVRADGLRRLSPVSLTALLFHQAQLGILQVGACQLFRYRGGILSPLTRDHAWSMPDGRRIPTRAIGLDAELSIDHTEDTAEPADRYLLLTGQDHLSADALYTALAEALAAAPATEPPEPLAQRLLAQLGGAEGCIMVLDILATPSAAPARTDNFADLPLRPAPREGDVWDGFALGKTLYRGRYTMLKAAYDTIEKREVALKIPLPSMLQDEIFTAGFLREAWIGTTVRGGAIARYLDLAPDRRSSLYLVMPLYKGETLEARLRRGPGIGVPEGVGIALKLCEAVQDLAAIQIVHRDIKPENIMLVEGNEIRLLDLGLAYLPGIDVADSVKPGGTIRYMAPELLQGVAANARTEVYALGVTLYRMFSGGAYPFGQREHPPLSRLRPDLPHWLGACLGRALDPKPAERFADAGEFARALQLGLINGLENDTRAPRRLPLSPLQIWQALTFLFAAGFLFLLLRNIK